MADPNPKRAKMDNPNGQSSSTSPKDCKIQPDLINLRTQCFNKVRSMPGFVDHTHFIRTFLLRDEIFGIFAPRRFGKSSHLNMVREFLQIDVDETTGEASSSVNGPAKGRKNYKVFEGTRIITDDNNKDLVEDHLGRHPVIHLDFKDANIISVEAAEMRYRLAVHKAFEDHSYLKTSKKLVPYEKGNAACQNYCSDWCDDERYKMQDLDDCMQNLTEYLYNHFNGAKVYILVDEIDSINARALLDVPRKKPDNSRMKKIQAICKVLGRLLGQVTKGCNLVAGALLTGVSYVASVAISELFNNLTILNFLEEPKRFAADDNLVPFYGATREEVENLIRRLVENKELVNLEGKKEFLNDTRELDTKKIMEFVKCQYNGYFDKRGNQVFSLWSVLQYLQDGEAINYWNQTNRINNLYMILKCDKVLPEIMKLMKGEMIEFDRHDTTTIQELVELYDLISAENKDYINSDVVFNFLMDQGYLSYPEGGDRNGKFGKFKLPNAEIKAALSNMIGEIVVDHWKIATISCTSQINDISLSLANDEKALQSKMLGVYEQISLMLRQLEDIDPAFVNETRISCVLYKALNDAESFEIGVDLQIKDAESGPITSCRRPDFLMHKNDEKFSILWEMKRNKSITDKYTTSLYALQEARGIVTTKSGNTKNYMDPVLKKLGREVLVIGLSVDSDIKLSLAYALGMEQKIFFKSESESTSFPDLYQEHNAVPLPLE